MRPPPAAACCQHLAGSATRSPFRDTMCTHSAGTQEKHGEVVEMLIEGKKKKSYNKSQLKGKCFNKKLLNSTIEISTGSIRNTLRQKRRVPCFPCEKMPQTSGSSVLCPSLGKAGLLASTRYQKGPPQTKGKKKKKVWGERSEIWEKKLFIHSP